MPVVRLRQNSAAQKGAGVRLESEPDLKCAAAYLGASDGNKMNLESNAEALLRASRFKDGSPLL